MHSLKTLVPSSPKSDFDVRPGLSPAASRGRKGRVSGEAALGIITVKPSSGIGASSSAINLVPKTPQISAIDPETGEITFFEQHGNRLVQAKPSQEESRQASYSLLASVKRVLPLHRTAQCLWQLADPNKTVQIIKDTEFNRARYNNLRLCGMVWTCPCCGRKISQVRGEEIRSAIDVAASMGIKVALLTCTAPHVIQDDLKTLLYRLLKSWRHFIDDRTGKTNKSDMGVVGTIRNMEVTHGDNGWHPHFHCLVFYKRDVDLAKMESRFAAHWQHVCVKSGLRRPSDAHGLTLQDGKHAAAYVTSTWGLEHEMTKSMAKLGRNGGRTPFDIIRDYEKGEQKDQNAMLFREFAAAFFGKRQLHWSKGLKKLLAVVDITDEEIAVMETERVTQLICELQPHQWKLVRPFHRATLLTLAEKDPLSIPVFLSSLQERLQQPAQHGQPPA